jgi:hypothetical protein
MSAGAGGAGAPLGQVGDSDEAAQAGRLEGDVGRVGRVKQIGDPGPRTGQATVLVDGQEHVRRAAAVGDEHGTLGRRALGARGILVELAARHRGGRHDRLRGS